MLLPRAFTPIIKERLASSQKGLVLYGARQVGKTTLVNQVLGETKSRILTVNGDQSRFQDTLSSRDLARIRSLVEGYDVLFVDEAQRIPEIGVNLKIILDNIPALRVIVTGSSSLDLASRVSEPLTGRIWTYRLYPIAFLELRGVLNETELDAQLEDRLVYGSYPEIFSYVSASDRREYLQNLSDAYLYKDLLEVGGLKNSSKIRDLLKLLAFQIGNQVSLSELGNTLNISKETVARYIDFLEKSFVVFRLKGLSRNLRKEVSKMDKVYFYDVGVRNILIDNLKPLKDRNDVGQIWENFLIIERMKVLSYKQISASTYFWRTHTGAELDFVEEREEKLAGFELKTGNKKVRAPTSWHSSYPNSTFTVINRENYLRFVLKPD